jgi:hypothetical protein
MRDYFRAIALVPRESAEWAHWFCIWSPKQSCYDFVAGQPESDESFRACVQRSVRQKLKLGKSDFLVANMAQLNMEFATVLPGECDPHHVAVAFYVVNLYRSAAREAVAAYPGGRWLSSRELLAGETSDGKPVSPTLTYLLRRSEVIQAHHVTR